MYACSCKLHARHCDLGSCVHALLVYAYECTRARDRSTLPIRINRNPERNCRVKLVPRNQWVSPLSDPRHLVRVAYCTDNRINGVPRNVTRCDLRETEGPAFFFLFRSVANGRGKRERRERMSEGERERKSETASSKIDSIGETIRR